MYKAVLSCSDKTTFVVLRLTLKLFYRHLIYEPLKQQRQQQHHPHHPYFTTTVQNRRNCSFLKTTEGCIFLETIYGQGI